MTGAFDPFGPSLPRLRPGVAFEHLPTGDGRSRLRLRATVALEGLATGRFAEPSTGVTWRADAMAPEVEFLGFAFTQFALPVVARAALDFDFRPAPGLRSPPVMLPLLARTPGGVTLLAPLDGLHEQIVAVGDGTLTWGWHGDLDRVSTGFATDAGLYSGGSVSEVLAMWRDDLGVPARPRSANPLLTHLSYWTDNGAAYWYRTEDGQTIAESIADKLDELRALDVPVRAVELDSWFYEHELPREIRPVGYPEEVPPTGAMSWTPRPDAFTAGSSDPGHGDGGGDALERFADGLGRPPLVLHARHISPHSPYVGDDWWVGEVSALPADPEFFGRWFDDAHRWGATCIEQDWMMVVWFGSRAVRSEPGRAAAWQRGLDALAAASGIDLLWCMATPADMVLAAELDQVIAVRTCDDYRFAPDPAFLWTWFLTVNRLADTLGLAPFKDCFFSRADVDGDADPIDGDPHAELEALLSALSGGPVGIGDRIGRTDRDVVMRTCDAGGGLRPVDRPIALIDDCLFGGPARGEGLAWATTAATDADGRVWTYVLAVNTAEDRREITDRRDLGVFGMAGAAAVWDWRRGASSVAAEIEASLGPRDWALYVCAPSVDAGAEGFGDTTKYVTVPSAAR